MKLIEMTQDMSGKYQALVNLTKDESVILKFHTLPTKEVVLAEAKRYQEIKQESEKKALKEAEREMRMRSKFESMTEAEKDDFLR